MSNIFKIAFEEAQEPIDTRTEQEIEEEHQRLALELDEDSRELEYQSDLVEGLESLKLIASQLDKPNSNEINLFRLAANMAVAGTKQSAQDFLPAMESNQQIAMEGFGTKIMDFIRAIIAKLKEWWNRFKEFVKGLFSKEKKVKFQINKVHEEIKQKVADKAEPTSTNIIFTTVKALDSLKANYIKNKVEVKVPEIKLPESVVKQEIKPEEKVEVKPEYVKPEKLNFELFVNNLLISKANIRDKKITLNSVNFTIEQIGSLSGIAMWSIVPYYKNHCEKYLKMFEADFETFKDLKNYSNLINSLRKEAIIRQRIALTVVKSDGDDYFNNSHDEQNPNPVLNDHFSSFLNVKIDQTNSTSHFNLSVTSFDGGADFHDVRASASAFVKCENLSPDVRKLLNLFNTDIENTKERKALEYSIIDKNSKEIEKINIHLQAFAEKLAKVVTDSKEEIDIKTSHIKQITDLCVLLNNTQKFSVKCLDVYFDTLEARTSLYQNLIVLYK